MRNPCSEISFSLQFGGINLEEDRYSIFKGVCLKF